GDSVRLQSGFSNSLNKVHSPNTCSGLTVAALMASWVRMKKSPSPLRSASYMCDSTSMKSRTTTPLEFNSRTSSFGPMVQTPTSLSDGKVAPQASSSSSLKPPAAGSSLKVAGQVLSRAALEISQAPTISLAASLGAAVCARAPTAESASAITARQARAGMGKPEHEWRLGARYHAGRAASCLARAPADSVASRACAEFTRAHDRFVFGGHGVSATG